MEERHGEGSAVRSFARPRYFYGQLLDVRHFESEQEYFKRKLWMLNRMVSGYGVVCGLDVRVGDDDHSVVVQAGLALDKCGREIVVPCQSKKIPIEPVPVEEEGTPEDGGNNYHQKDEDPCDDDWVHLVICYHECRADPEPVLTGGCDVGERCSPGSIREGYTLRLEPGRADAISVDSRIPNLIKGNNVNYRALVEWVSARCDHPAGSCIALANIRRPTGDATLEPADVDISVRPIVYGLDLLWELVLSLSHETQSRRTGKN